MPLDTLVAGAYAATYNSVGVGITRQGFELQQQLKQEVIAESDAYGEATIDWIYRGGDAFLQYLARAYKAGSTTPFWPWGGGSLGVMVTAASPIGQLASNVAVATVLSSTANTPAAAAPASLTASKALLAPNFDGRLLYDSRLREVPTRLQLLPYTSNPSTTIVWFTLT
jgi:hypothetical protein